MFSVLFARVKSTGHNDTSLVLPFDVLETLQSEASSPKEVVDKLIENRQLEHTSLKQPDPETRKWIRCLGRNAKNSNRTDVVKYLRQVTPAGTTGRCDTCIVVMMMMMTMMVMTMTMTMTMTVAVTATVMVTTIDN